MTEAAELRPGETVLIEPVTRVHVERGDGTVKVEARATGRLRVTVRGHGRIWDGITTAEPTPAEIAGLVADGLEVVRWTPESGKPAPGTAVWTGR